MSERSNDLALERLALGELPPAEADALRARLGAELEPRLAQLRASNAEILAAHPPAAVRAEVERRLVRPPRRVIWLMVPLASAAAATFMLWPAPVDDAPLVATRVRPEPGETRIKGLAPHLLLHRQEGDHAVQLAEPAQARAHDRLQISYVAAEASHGVVVSIDGSGVVTLHHPAKADASTALSRTGAVALPQSYELDAAPGFERFIFVTAGEPLAPARVLAAARELAGTASAASDPLVLPPTWRQTSFLVTKVAP